MISTRSTSMSIAERSTGTHIGEKYIDVHHGCTSQGTQTERSTSKMTQTSCASTPLDVWPALPTDKLRLHENNAEIKVIDKETGESAMIGTYNVSIPFAIIPTHPIRQPPWATYAKCFAVYEADGCLTWFASGWSRYDGYASSEPLTVSVQCFAKDVLGLNLPKDQASHAEVQAFMH